MNLKINILHLIVLLFCAIHSFAQVDEYEYKRSILEAKEGWNVIDLPIDIFSNTNTKLSDLRIYSFDNNDNKSTEQPYILDIQEAISRQKDVKFKIINPTESENIFSYTFELSNEESVNNILLDFYNNNFDWKIHLEGSMDQNSWSTIVKDYRIVSLQNGETDFEYSNISISESKFNFYKISFRSSFQPKLEKATLSKKTKSNSKYISYPIQSSKIEEDSELKTTTITIDLGKKLPVSQLKLNCSTENDYYRSFKIQNIVDSFETDTGWHYKYKTFYQGTINSFDGNVYKFHNRLVQKLQITINNYDNQPLTFVDYQLKGPNYRLISRLDHPVDELFLYYGNSTAKSPRYDISYFKDKIPEEINKTVLGEPSYSPKGEATVGPFFKNKWWLWGILLLVIVLLGTFTLRMLRE